MYEPNQPLKAPVTLPELFALSGDDQGVHAELLTLLFTKAGFNPETDKISSFQELDRGQKFELKDGYTFVQWGDPSDPFLYLFLTQGAETKLLAAFYLSSRGSFIAEAWAADTYWHCTGRPVTPADKSIVSAAKDTVTLSEYLDNISWEHTGWLEGAGGIMEWVMRVADEINPTMDVVPEEDGELEEGEAG